MRQQKRFIHGFMALCNQKSSHKVSALLHGFTGELDATKANAATLVAQLQLETADKQQLSTKLADSESIKNELEAKVCPLLCRYHQPALPA